MARSYRKTPQPWLARQDPNDPDINPNYRRSIRYYNKLYQAWPEWAANDPRIKAVYEEAERLRAMGFDVVVDHVVPLCSELVCGLHCYDNLQITDKVGNANKSNRWWPDMPDGLQLPLL